MLSRLDQSTRIRSILLSIILLTLPCYCLGIILLISSQNAVSQPTPTITFTPTETPVPPTSIIPTITSSATATYTNTPTITWTASPTYTPFSTPTHTATNTYTPTPSDTPTETPTITSTPTYTETVTLTPTPTDTPTLTPIVTETEVIAANPKAIIVDLVQLDRRPLPVIPTLSSLLANKIPEIRTTAQLQAALTTMYVYAININRHDIMAQSTRCQIIYG